MVAANITAMRSGCELRSNSLSERIKPNAGAKITHCTDTACCIGLC